MQCPQCNSEMYDNQGKKRSAKSPDFKCKNQSCGHAIWLDSKKGQSAPVGSVATAQQNGGAKWTWGALSMMYSRSLAIAEKHLTANATRSTRPFQTDDLIAATATIFIAATRDGVRSETAKAAPPPPPPPPPMPEPVEQLDEDSDLPF